MAELTHSDELSVLRARLALVERRQTRLVRAGALVVGVAAVATTAAFRAAAPRIVEAERLVLRDSTGAGAAELTFDGAGRLQVQLRPDVARGAQAELALVDASGRVVARLGSQYLHPATQ